jgi:TonB-dependent starch-binding outer membrane protein SusC
MPMRQNLLFLCFILIVACFSQAIAQDRVVSGRVTDTKTGEGIPGLSVFVKGTTTGTITDPDGKYTITVGQGATLVFQAVGIKTQEIVVGTQSSLDVQVEQDVADLSEVIITGYREEDKRSFGGAGSTVQSKAIAQVPIASFDQVLQGQAPGLMISAASGQPGTGAEVRIRGVGSLGGRNSPLYIMDGVEITAAQFATLNANDFERVDILRDAGSAAIYGSRGTNGVIVITTKKGKAQKTQFNYSYQYGVSTAPDWKVKVMNSNQKIDIEKETGIRIGPPLTTELEARLRSIETDWAREIFNYNAVTQNHEISASGGNESTNFYISGGVFKQEGVVRNTALDRYTGRININHTSNGFRFGTNISLGYSKSNFTQEANAFIAAPLNAVRWSNPYETVLDPNTGGFNGLVNADGTARTGYRLASGQPNGKAELDLNIRDFQDVKIVSTLYMEYDIPRVKGLYLRTNWGVDYLQRQNSTLIDPNTASGRGSRGNRGSYSRINSRDARFTGTTSINYNTKFGEDHTLTVGLFNEIVYRTISNFNFTGFGINERLKNEAGITPDNRDFIPVVGGNALESALVSYFADANYGYKGKYFLKAVARIDGSSRFGANRRYATFFSASASWVLSQESFMDFADKFLSNLKVRASYGSLGNQEFGGFYDYNELIATGAAYAGQVGYQPVNIANPNLQWEASTQLNLGLDFGFWDDRITGTLDYYNKLTKDLLYDVPTSLTTGFGSQIQNIGSIRNRGVELQLNAEILRTKDFSLRIGGNVAYNRNQLVNLDEGREDVKSEISILQLGAPINSFYLVPYAGVNPANGDALYVDLDGNVTPNFSTSFQRRFGTADAPWIGGITTSIAYKGFEISALFSWMAGHYKYNNERINIDNPDYITDNVSVDLLRAWRKPGDLTDVPRLDNPAIGQSRSPYVTQTTRYLEKSDFLRFRNLIVSYTIPAQWLSAIKLRSIRVFAQGQNLLTFTPWRGNDPEVTNTSGAVYPTQRTFTFGINVGF